MRAEDTSGWSFDTPVGDESEIECPECLEWSPVSAWEHGYVPCEACGDHSAIDCPRCGHSHDIVHSDLRPLRVRAHYAA